MQNYRRLIKYISSILILIALLVPAASASAALRICRTDPLVFFTDGNILSITASFAGEPSAVKAIVYTVHAPAGSQVARIVHTAGGLGLEETVFVTDDQPAGVYRVDTVVHAASEDLVATTTIMLVRGQTGTASGITGELYTVMVTDGSLASAAQNLP